MSNADSFFDEDFFEDMRGLNRRTDRRTAAERAADIQRKEQEALEEEQRKAAALARQKVERVTAAVSKGTKANITLKRTILKPGK